MGGASKLLMLLSTPLPLIYPHPFALRLARHSRVHLAPLSSVAAAASSAHCRLLSPAPHPGPGFSVRAAEEVHTQAVAREGYGEPLVSPPNSRARHPWPEWSKLVAYLMARGYSNRLESVAAGDDDDSFLDPANAFFALISQHCIPLHSFRFVYHALLADPGASSVSSSGGRRRRHRRHRRHRSFIEILANTSLLWDRYNACGENCFGAGFFFAVDFRCLIQLFGDEDAMKGC